MIESFICVVNLECGWISLIMLNGMVIVIFVCIRVWCLGVSLMFLVL